MYLFMLNKTRCQYRADIAIMEARITKRESWEDIVRHKIAISVAFVAVFILSFVILASLDFIPEAIENTENPNSLTSVTLTQKAQESPDSGTPKRIVIDAIGVDAPIISLESRDVAVLDAALLEGVVHYPGSGTLHDESNMLLFGHSSGLPIIHNQNYKIFNDLK